MAVVQISRIQIRRGRKNQGSGLPQLASGEFGWAVDAQELFIGNGSVAEGSPYVGNTKILTEHDNLFEYASTYTYRSDVAYIQTGSTVTTPVIRTLQERLDDRVSVRAFNCMGDGTDQTDALQRAIFQLFLNSANKTNPQSRVELYLEPGTYNLSSTIFLPPFTTIIGAGVGKTVIVSNTWPDATFKTINGDSTPEVIANDATTSTDNQARNLNLSNFTILTEGTNIPALNLTNCVNSTFKNIAIEGLWRSGNALGDAYSTADYAVELNALSTAVTCSGNIFENISINGHAYGFKSKYDIVNNNWDKCNLRNCAFGFYLGVDTILGSSGQLTGPSNNTISNSIFNDIDNEAIWIENGSNNVSSSNKFYAVGNEGGSSINPMHPVLRFGTYGNLSKDDWFQRSADLGYNLEYLFSVPFVPEVHGPVITQNSFTQYIRLTELGEPTKLVKFPADTARGIEIDYIYKSNEVQALRKGTIHITVDPTNDLNLIADDYDYVGDNSLAENLKFTAQNFDENGDAAIDTVALMVMNSTNNDDADFYFRVKTKT